MSALAKKFALLATLITLAGCVGTDVGNPPQPSRTELAFSAQVADDTDEGGDGEALMVTRHHALVLDSGVTIEDAWFNVESATVRSDDDCSPTGDFTDEETFAVDLLDGQTHPRSINIGNPSGAYCQVRLQFEPSIETAEAAPAELSGASILIRGARTDGTAFVLRVEDSVQLRYIGQPNPIEIEPGVNRFFSSHRIDRWLDSASLDDVDGSDTILIDADNNQRILQQFVREFRLGAKLHRDGNKNGRLDATEAAGPIGSAE